jgi:membrane fusion protein (multidrug efflux system)
VIRILACLTILASLVVIATADAGAPVNQGQQSYASEALDGTPVRGLLLPVNEATLSSETGGSIAQVFVHDGSRFAKGEKLIQFDCNVKEAELKKADAELHEARETHSGNLKLREYKAVSDLQVTVSNLNVEKAAANHSLIQSQVDRCLVTAPFSGRVTHLRVKRYETVSQAQPLIEIIDDSALEIRLLAPSRWLTWLKPHTPFQITIDEVKRPFKAKVTTVGARVDPASQTIEVLGSIEAKPGELLAGMSGTASFTAN